ncbi:MAG: HAD-IIA family hydrolase [Candidatus Rokubacteria bacterium]|nr:HAD-IIA family hydrolase [Candidatus Rokubacteria bacterium]
MGPRFPYRGFVLDLDGTVYRGERLLPGAKAAVAALREAGRRVCFLSNKPIASREDYAAKLTRLGVPTEVDEVINSSYVLARHLAREVPGARCFVIGEPPLVAELERAGLAPVDGPRVDYVVVAFDRTFDYRKLDVALQAVKRHGARLIGTNPDRTCPTEDGEIPDAAGMIGAVEGVTGCRVDPIVGKPSPIMLRVALERLGLEARDCAVVGDRLETDIAMGKAAGLATILVLTGITPPGDPAIARWRPDHVLASLEEILA